MPIDVSDLQDRHHPSRLWHQGSTLGRGLEAGRSVERHNPTMTSRPHLKYHIEPPHRLTMLGGGIRDLMCRGTVRIGYIGGRLITQESEKLISNNNCYLIRLDLIWNVRGVELSDDVQEAA